MVLEEKNQKYEIGIYETVRHVPVLYNYMKICKTKKTNVTLFLSEHIYSRLLQNDFDKNDFNFVIKKNNESIYAFVKRVKEYCNENIDILFVNTIHETLSDLIKFINFDLKCKTVLTVHHANAWIKPKLVVNPLKPLMTGDTLIGVPLIKNFIFPYFDAINVIYKPLRKYIYDNMNYQKEIFTFPTSTFEEEIYVNNQNDNKKLRISIPGLIQSHRKNYTPVIIALEALCKKYKDKLEIYVPGQPVGPFGRNTVKQFNKLSEYGSKIVTFNEFVPDEVFDDLLNKCDIIIAPIKIQTRADNLTYEEYGRTVGSGVIYNAVKFARPIIVPAEFNMLEEFNSSSFGYKDEVDLEQILEDIIQNPAKLKELKVKALENSRSYSLKNLQNYFEKEVLGWLKK